MCLYFLNPTSAAKKQWLQEFDDIIDQVAQQGNRKQNLNELC